MYESKNLIVIIGNGFDLAHGMKTSYIHYSEHFITNYIAEELIRCNEDNDTESELLKQSMLVKLVKNSFLPSNHVFIQLKELLHQEEINKKDIIENLKSNSTHLDYILDNRLLSALYKTQSEYWFDVERVYFKLLVEIYNTFKDRSDDSYIIKAANNLHYELSLIKTTLKNYLKNQPIGSTDFISDFMEERVFISSELDNVYFLNFNYTSTLDEYTKLKYSDLNYVVNPIHGRLSGEVVFGYGNDKIAEYEELRKLEINELLHGFKTYDYGMNINYMHIYREALDIYEDFEVLVLGHSLGLTDKTLLEEIFNSEKCKRIHIPKRTDLKNNLSRQKSEFKKLYMAASRIISDDSRVRKIIVDFDSTISFP